MQFSLSLLLRVASSYNYVGKGTRASSKYIAVQAPRFKHICISWFGGEPTLCKDIILRISKQIFCLQSKYMFHYSAAMTTNGYMLDINSFLKYYECGITSYLITLDGWRHDNTRPHVSGKSTLKTIIDNVIAISHLPKEKYQFTITLRRNLFPEDYDFTWYDYLSKLLEKMIVSLLRFFLFVIGAAIQ